jgi:hypothetical protein
MHKLDNWKQAWLVTVLILIVSCCALAKHEQKARRDLIVQGRVVATYVTFVDLVRLTDLPNVETLIVRIERVIKGKQQSRFIKIRYQCWEGEPSLPDSILDSTKRLRFSLSRDHSCDSSLGKMKGAKPATQKGAEVAFPYFKFTSETEGLTDDTNLPCYVLKPGDYRVQK